MYSKSQCHIHLLSNQEIKDIYDAPQFNNGERTLHFSLTDKEMLIIKKYRTVKAQTYFIQLLGCFKAKQKFYGFELGADNDTQYILEKYFNRSIQHGQLDIKTYKKNDILMLLNFLDFLPEFAPKIQSHLCSLIQLYPKTHDSLRHLLNYFDAQRIVFPFIELKNHLSDGKKKAQIAREFGISRETLYQYLRNT